MPKNPVKIKRETLSEKVEAALREMLVSGRWKNGERILSEAELADMFGVSKLTVRTAVQRLRLELAMESLPRTFLFMSISRRQRIYILQLK